jgi:pyruvate/2-oxoglutarate dehydrogenase complex dihydrolipoamide acyltransferase (E2) component
MSELQDIRLPELGEGVTEATFVEWLVTPGAGFDAGDVLAEVMTDKVAIEVTAEAAGTLRETLAQPDEQVAPGATLGRYEVRT